MSERKRFSGKSVALTGAAAGMGKEIILSFLREGASAVGLDLDEEGLVRLKEEFEAGQRAGEYPEESRLLILQGDVSRQASDEALINLAVSAFGKLDILVNNAGIAGHSETVTEVTNEQWDRVIQVDLYGPMYAIRAAVKQMLRQESGGSIVTTASVAGLDGCRACVQYTAAKHGLIGLCRHTAYTYMHQGIRSNVVCPGIIDTGLLADGMSNESPLGKERISSGIDQSILPGQPADVAAMVLYLSSEEARYINGASIVVDGGLTSCGR